LPQLTTKLTVFIYGILALPTAIFMPGIETYSDVLFRAVPLMFLSFVSLLKLRGLNQALITLSLWALTLGVCARVLLTQGNQLAWAATTLLALICYGICFWSQAKINYSQLLKVLPLFVLLSLSSFWAFPAYDVLSPAMWLLAGAASFMLVGAAFHHGPSLWIYIGSLALFSSLALFGLHNRLPLEGLILRLAYVNYFFSHAAIVLGLIHYQAARFNRYNDAVQK